MHGPFIQYTPFQAKKYIKYLFYQGALEYSCMKCNEFMFKSFVWCLNRHFVSNSSILQRKACVGYLKKYSYRGSKVPIDE